MQDRRAFVAHAGDMEECRSRLDQFAFDFVDLSRRLHETKEIEKINLLRTRILWFLLVVRVGELARPRRIPRSSQLTGGFGRAVHCDVQQAFAAIRIGAYRPRQSEGFPSQRRIGLKSTQARVGCGGLAGNAPQSNLMELLTAPLFPYDRAPLSRGRHLLLFTTKSNQLGLTTSSKLQPPSYGHRTTSGCRG